MVYSEEAVVFACAGDMLVGILAKPEIPFDTGIVVIVGGPQYRAGSHRQFVRLSRSLAAAGYAALRFDYRGMGDSEGHARDFETVRADVCSAIDSLQECLPTVKKIVLWGLCDGASAALLYYDETQDSRISGLCLLNPWVRSELSLARTQIRHYYTQRLLQKEFWIKFLSGKLALGALTGFAQKLRLSTSSKRLLTTAPLAFQQRMASACLSFSGRQLLILSSEDYTAKEFMQHTSEDYVWNNALAKRHIVRHIVQGADHTFSDAKSDAMVQNLTLEWLANRNEINSEIEQ